MTVNKVSPEQMLTHVQHLERMVTDLNGRYVAVGLPAEKVGGHIHGEGRTIVENAVVHEFGSANGKIPERSFLRMPFKVKDKELGAGILREFQDVFSVEKNTPIDKALGRIGLRAVNIVKGAFRTGGYGKWKKLAESTVAEKGFSDILEDTRVTRNSITWVIRND